MLARPKRLSDPEAVQALRPEELAAHKTAILGRSLSLAVIAVLVTFLTPWPGPLFTHALLFVFALLGWASLRVAKATWGRPWHQYLFILADFLLLTFTLLYPNPLIPFDYPPQFSLRYGPFIYFFVLLSGLAYVYQPKLVLWGGISACIAWSIGVGWLLSLPDTIWPQNDELSVENALALAAHPTFIDVDIRIQELAVFMISAGLLALAVSRSRRIALRQAQLARERENLGRYFPRKTAQMLAERNDPFSTPSEHSAAVLFADLVSFTNWSERHSPIETIDLLRDVHGLLAEIVFRHNGTLDKFIGDGVMATFGTPEPTENDACNALAAATEMIDAFERWKTDEKRARFVDLELAIGVHYGPVVIGNIGSAQRLEFAVLGDTVNVASRLESATRELRCRCLASHGIISAAKQENNDIATPYSTRFMHHGPVKLKGRQEALDVYVL